MVVLGTEQVSPEVIKITSDTGLAFFVRTSFLKIVLPEQLVVNAEFHDVQEEDILDAGMIYSAECKAVSYLERAEQSRFGLTQKLINKKFGKKYIDKALDYLEKNNYLSDYRFSKSWLNTRKINHFEGRTKLLGELMSRGISKDVCNTVLDDFFSETSEEILCKSAYEKFIRCGKTGDKLIRSMMNAGFSYSLIKRICNSSAD